MQALRLPLTWEVMESKVFDTCVSCFIFFQNKTPWSFGLQKYDISKSTVFSILIVCSCGNMKKMAVDRPLKSGFIHPQEV